MERTSTFIKVWFWSRNDPTVPADVKTAGANVNTDAWVSLPSCTAASARVGRGGSKHMPQVADTDAVVVGHTHGAVRERPVRHQRALRSAQHRDQPDVL